MLALAAFLLAAIGGVEIWVRPLAVAADQQHAEEQADICQGYLLDQLARLQVTALDWANWDAMRAHLAERDAAFAEENLTLLALNNLELDGMLLLDAGGRVVNALVEGSRQFLFPGHEKFLQRLPAPRSKQLSEEGAVTSVVAGDGHLFLVAAAAARGSDGRGVSTGEVVVFRTVTDADLNRRPGVQGARAQLLPSTVTPVAAAGDDGWTSVSRLLHCAHGSTVAQLDVRTPSTHQALLQRASAVVAGMVAAAAVLIFGGALIWRQIPRRR